MKLALTTVLGDQPQVWPLDGPCIRIGRARSNAVQIPAASVSREHAEIAVKGDRLLLKDLHSRNGIWLNGVRVRRSVQVKPGDRIQVGRIWLNLAERPPEGAGAAVSESETSDTLEVPASDFISRGVGVASRPGELVRLLEKAGRELFGDRRVDRAVKAAARRPCLDDAGGAVIRKVDAFRGPHPREDDITVVFLRRASAMKGG